MSENTGFQFTDDAVPRAYEEVLVHRMFEPWAVLLLDACDLRPDAVVLDVATGPGTVARLAARRIGRGGRVVATDISRPMLDAAALGEMRRALKPGGQLAIAAWSHIEDNAFYAALHAALRESVSRDLADRLLAPFNWPDAQVLKNTIEAAGFHQTQVRSKALPLIFESGIAQAARALEATPLAPSLATLPEGTQLKLKAAIGANLAPLLRDGKVSANMTSNIAVART